MSFTAFHSPLLTVASSPLSVVSQYEPHHTRGLGWSTACLHPSRAFVLYCKEYAAFQSSVYLTKALLEPIMNVLADDQLDLEIEPTVIWSR